MINATYIAKVENGFTVRVDSTKLRTGSDWDTLDKTFVVPGNDIKKVTKFLSQLWEEGDENWASPAGQITCDTVPFEHDSDA